MSLWQRIQLLFGRKRFEHELDDELRFHLDAQIEANLRAGMSPQEARRQAMLELGGLEQVKEQVRVVRPGFWMETLWQDVRFGARMLRKNPGFTAVAVLTLALGIGANTAIFSLVRGILVQPLPFPDADRLVVVWNEYEGKPSSNSPPDYLDRRNESRTLEEIAALRFANLNLSGTGAAERVPAARVTASFFSVLGVPPQLGRTFTPAEDEPGREKVVVLSHGCWQRRFGGDRTILGRTTRLNGEPYTVLGVMPPGFNALFAETEVWVPIAFTPAQTSDANRGNEYLTVIARRKPEFTLAQVEAEMDAIAARVPERNAERRDFLLAAKWSASVVPLREQFVGEVRPALLVLFAAVGLVLLIACANVANLLLARASRREKEMALRSALGAGRGRIARQLLVESVLLSVAGGAAGLLLAQWGVDMAKKFGPSTVPLLDRVSVDLPVLLFLFGLSILTGLLFGLVPVFRLSRGDLQHSLKEGSGNLGTRQRHRVGAALVASEFALSLILLAGTGLFLQSLRQLLQVHPGFRSENRLTLRLSLPPAAYSTGAQQTAFFRELLPRLEALPGVTAAGAVQSLPLAGTKDTSTVRVEGLTVPPGATPPSAEYRMVTPGYRRAMGIPLLSGRDFDERDTADATRVALVDEKAAEHFWPNQNPLGKRFSFGGDNWREVVGVVGTVHNVGLDVVPMEQVYLPYAQAAQGNMYVVLKMSGAPLELSEAVRKTVLSLDRDMPVYDVRSMGQRLETSLAQRRSGVAVLVAFALAALVLAAVGIYGVMAYSVSERTREIGIRIALGAGRGSILRLVVGRGIRLAAIGAAAGLAGAFGVTRLLEGLLFGVKPADPLTFAGATLLLCAVAVLACYIPARRATRVDPMVALRYE